MVLGTAPGDVQALAAQAYDLTVGDRPLLTAASIAVHDNDLRAVVRDAAHDVQAYTRHAGALDAVRDNDLRRLHRRPSSGQPHQHPRQSDRGSLHNHSLFSAVTIA